MRPTPLHRPSTKLERRLIEACYKSPLAEVKNLIDQGVSWLLVENDGTTPLLAAARNKDRDVVRFIYDLGGHPIDQVTRLGDGLIHFFAHKGDVEDLAWMLDSGINVNLPGYKKNTPLHNACIEGHIPAIEFLISKGADPNARTDTGRTPLHLCSIANGSAGIDALLAAGADLEAVNKFGDTPLLTAALYAHAEWIKALVSRGANLEVRGTDGNTPLLLAAKSDKDSVPHSIASVAALIAAGADVNATNKRRSTLQTLCRNRPELKVLVDALAARQAIRGTISNYARRLP